MSGNQKLKKKRSKTVVHNKVRNLHTNLSGLLSSDPVGNTVEAEMMCQEEQNQRKIDLFWGIDKDNAYRAREKEGMGLEDFYSTHIQKSSKQIEKERQWDEEYHYKKLEEQRTKGFEKEVTMTKYLQKVATSDTPDDLLNYVWNQPTSSAVPNFASNTSNSIRFDSSTSMIGSSTDSLSNSILPTMKNDGTQVNIPTVVSIHQDGLQQSRAVINDAEKRTGQPLKRVNNESMVEEHTMKVFTLTAHLYYPLIDPPSIQ